MCVIELEKEWKVIANMINGLPLITVIFTDKNGIVHAQSYNANYLNNEIILGRWHSYKH